MSSLPGKRVLNGAATSEASRSILKRCNVNVFGRGTQPIVFSHGFGTDQRMWRMITPYFADEWRIVLHDLIGSGNSDRLQYSRPRYTTLDGYADDLLQICEALDLTNIVLVGHSMSGMAAIKAANRDPGRIDKLVLIGASPRFLNDEDYFGGFERADIEELLYLLESNHRAWAEQMAPLVMANADRPELAQELASSFCEMDPGIAHHFAKAAFLADSRQDAAACRTPALILQCTHDVLAPVAVGEYLARTMPHAVLKLIEGTGHFPHLSEPEQVAQHMRRFLASGATDA